MRMMLRRIGYCTTSIVLFYTIASTVGAVETGLSDRQIKILAEKMCCKGCARNVSSKLYAARGVKTVEVDMKTHTVRVSLQQKGSATLGQLWTAVEQGDGGPTRLTTADATYTFTPKRAESELGSPAQHANHATQVVVENLHCVGCAKKIGAQLYAPKGVTKVRADLHQDTLTVETSDRNPLSPWEAIEAVTKVKERPLAVSGAGGTISIEWATKQAPKKHRQYQQAT